MAYGPAEDEEAARDSNVVVFLSIFLLLLGFFILLNAISNQEQVRSEMAFGSVTATFQSGRPTPTQRIAAGTTAGVFKSGASFRESLEGIFAKTLPTTTQADLPAGAVLRLVVPVGRFFRLDSAAIHGGSEALLDAIADLMTRNRAGRRLEIEALFASGGAVKDASVEPGAVGEVGHELALLRAEAMAVRLRRLGVAGNSIRVGLAPLGADRLELTFYERSVAEAALRFDNLVN